MTAIVLIVSALLVLADQLIKLWVLAALPGAPSVTLIPGLLQLTYVENRGAAFGIFQGRVGLLSIVTLAVIAVAVWLLVSGKIRHKLAMWSVGLIVAGGLGNLIDRIFRAFVVDYLDVSPLFHFPVFNFADCCVVVGTILLAVWLLFLEGRDKKVPPLRKPRRAGALNKRYFAADEADAGERVDRWIAGAAEDLSRSVVQRAV